MTDLLTKPKPSAKESDVFTPSNKCKDFDEDCDGTFCPTKCWLYDPSQGWCPLIKQGDTE